MDASVIDHSRSATEKLDCVDLDECACYLTNGCGPIAEPCYCPLPKCGAGACICGGGFFLACAPVMLTTCAAAKARVAEMCPTLAGPTFENLCDKGDLCTIKCLNQVSSCGDVDCSFGELDCARDAYSSCFADCKGLAI